MKGKKISQELNFASMDQYIIFSWSCPSDEMPFLGPIIEEPVWHQELPNATATPERNPASQQQPGNRLENHQPEHDLSNGAAALAPCLSPFLCHLGWGPGPMVDQLLGALHSEADSRNLTGSTKQSLIPPARMSSSLDSFCPVAYCDVMGH